MSEIRVRSAGQTDLEAITELLGQLEDSVERPASEGESPLESNVRALLDDPSARLLVAESSAGIVGRWATGIVGMINLSIRRTVLHPGPSALIDELVVDSSRRGQGIGRLLVAAALQEARFAGCCEIEVSTEKSNDTAQKFYRNCGFDEEAVLFEQNL